MEFSSGSGSSPQNVILDSQSQLLHIQPEILQPQHVVEIQQSELASNTQSPDFSILQPGAENEGNTLEVVYSEVAEDNMEYSFEDVTDSMQANRSVIVEYETSGTSKLVYDDLTSGDQTNLQEDILAGGLQLVTDSKETIITDVANYSNFAFEKQNVTGLEKDHIHEEIVKGEDICQIHVEVRDQVYLEDMKNIDILVVYSCKKCGYGDQNVADAINHTRSCSYISPNREELNAKLSKVFNLFKTFSHRSIPLSECIAPAASLRSNQEKKETGKPKTPKSIANPKPRETDSGKGLSEEDIELLINKCKDAWKGVSNMDAGVVIEPRKWFCTECAATVIFSETEHGYHTQCHSTEPKGKKFSCSLCKTSEEGRRKILECDDWNTMKTHLTTMHKVNMKLECSVCNEIFPSHQKYHKHVRSHKHQCRYESCGFTSTTKQTVLTHERCHDLDDSLMFRCFKCDWVSEAHPNKWNLMHIHLTRNHPGTIEPLYKCKLCGREFPEMRRYNSHVTSCKLLPVPLRPTCLVCGKSVSDTELREHILKHAASKHWYPKMKEVLSGNPQSHAVVVKDETRADKKESMIRTTDSIAVLPDAKKVFVTSSEIEKQEIEKQNSNTETPARKKQKRVLVSSGLLTEKCSFCYKKFATALRLEKHIKRSHPDGETPTVCDTCGSSFRNKEQWRNHNRQVHLGIKRKAAKTQKTSARLYMCETCTYATPNLARLRNHYSSVHMGVHPYHCKQCSYKTNEPSDLRRHMLKHEGKKPFACENCDYKTTQRWILVNHAQRVHGVKLPKRPHDTMGCEFSLKRNPATQGGSMKRKPEASEVQYDELNGEVMLQIDDSGEAARLLASLASSAPGGLVTVQEGGEDYMDGQQVVMLHMKQEEGADGGGDA